MQEWQFNKETYRRTLKSILILYIVRATVLYAQIYFQQTARYLVTMFLHVSVTNRSLLLAATVKVAKGARTLTPWIWLRFMLETSRSIITEQCALWVEVNLCDHQIPSTCFVVLCICDYSYSVLYKHMFCRCCHLPFQLLAFPVLRVSLSLLTRRFLGFSLLYFLFNPAFTVTTIQPL